MSYPNSAANNALGDLDEKVAQLKRLAVDLRANAETSITGDRAISVYVFLKTTKAQLTTFSAIAGLDTLAKVQKGNPNLVLTAEVAAINAAIDAVTTWITTNFPADGNGYLLNVRFNVTGITPRVFNAAALAGLRTHLDALIALIE